MITSARAAGLIFLAAAFLAGPSQAAEDVTLLKDLTAVIMLLGKPCGQVVSAKPHHGGKDYIASCKNGSRYRVFVNAEDRVVAQKQ